MHKRSGILEDAKAYPHLSCRNHLAFMVLHKLPNHFDGAMLHNIGNQINRDND